MCQPRTHNGSHHYRKLAASSFAIFFGRLADHHPVASRRNRQGGALNAEILSDPMHKVLCCRMLPQGGKLVCHEVSVSHEQCLRKYSTQTCTLDTKEIACNDLGSILANGLQEDLVCSCFL